MILLAWGNTWAATEKVLFSYDATGTLTAAAYGPENTLTYTYDDGGNLLHRLVRSGINLADAITVLRAVAGFGYPTDRGRIDVDGNQKTGLAEAVYILQRLAEDRK